jgi:hypothetical protein
VSRPGSNKARKEASKRLALNIQQRYRRLVEAQSEGEDALAVATADMAMIMYENVEFIINVLRDYGGLEAKFEPLTTKVAAAGTVTPLPDISALVAAPAVPDKCTCPPMEPGIIGYKHMTSCPQFELAPALPATPQIFRAGCDVDMPRKKTP